MKSKVFLVKTRDDPTKEEVARAAINVFQAGKVSDKIDPGEYLAIKLHVGDKNNTTHVDPEVIAALVSMAKKRNALVFLTETSTLYRGKRENAVKHITHAVSQGFSLQAVGAPFIMADGLAGDMEIEVKINGELFDSVLVAREARMIDFLLVVSHMTGHIAAGFGCAIKNLGMGLASRKGKMRQHSSINPQIIPDNCTLCKKCMQWCPKDAIVEKDGAAYINLDKCIGCGECLAVCRFGAVKFNWGTESSWMQKAMAEHALGAISGKKSFFINVLVNMTRDCDCLTAKQEKIIPDIGVLGSWDPVAIDQASLDLTRNDRGKNLGEISYPNIDGNIQLEHAEKIGLGNREYELISLE